MGSSLVLKRLTSQKELNDFDKELLSSNLLGAKNLTELQEREKLISEIKTREIKASSIKGNFDYAHLKAIHRYIFEDIYSWAGLDRYEINLLGTFRKGNTHFTSGEKLPVVAKALFDALKDENYFCDLSKDEFIESLAIFMNGLNILHPFREGNGRVQRIFVEMLAHNAGFDLNLSVVSKDVMIQASIQGAKGNPKGFEVIIRQNIKEQYERK